jgi:hypothetical protein
VVVFIDEVEEIAGLRQPRTVTVTQGVTNEMLKLIPPFRERDERLLGFPARSRLSWPASRHCAAIGSHHGSGGPGRCQGRGRLPDRQPGGQAAGSSGRFPDIRRHLDNHLESARAYRRTVKDA